MISFLQTWNDDRYYWTLIFDTSLIDLGLDSRSQECKKEKSSVAVISKFSINLEGMWYAVDTCWCDVNLIVILILSHPFNIQGREPYSCDFIKKEFMLACIQTFTGRFLSNHWALHFDLYQFGWLWSSFKVTVVWVIKNCGVHFLRNFAVDLDEIHYVSLWWRSC